MAQLLPTMMQNADEAPASDGAVFAAVPVIAIFDAPPVVRGQTARFPIRMLSGSGPFTVNVATVNLTAQEGVHFVGVQGPRSYFTNGELQVETLDDGELTAVEFAVDITVVTPAFIVRARAIGLIADEVDTGVYNLDVYEDEVYE